MTGDPEAAIRSAIASHALITILNGAPPIHIASLRLVGHVRVEGGELRLTDCSIEEANEQEGSGRQLSVRAVSRALTITGGHVLLMRAMLRGHTAGAIEVANALLTLIECVIENNRAPVGGAMLVGSGAIATVVHSNLTGNRASESGGAIQVASSHEAHPCNAQQT